MTIRDDGDIIRGLGFVALYAAYIEEAIDACVDSLKVIDTAPKKELAKWPISRKLHFCTKLLDKLDTGNPEIEDLRLALSVAAGLLEHRHDVLHGRIYAQYGQPDVRKSGRIGVPDREINSEELYQLANSLFGTCKPIMHGAQFAIPRAIRMQQNNRNSDNA